MSNNDFEEDVEAEEEFDSGTTLGELWRNNPMIKVAAIAGGVMVFIITLFTFRGSEEKPEISVVGGRSTVSEVPGEDVPKAYEEAIESANQKRANDAAQFGGSAMPTPVGSGRGRLEIPVPPEEEEDPLAQWRAAIEAQRPKPAPQPPVQQQMQQIVQPQVDPNVVKELSQAMATQMQSILERQTPQPSSLVTVSSAAFLREQEAAMMRTQAESAEAASAAESSEVKVAANVKPLVSSGSIAYAQLLTGADSDIGGPILAQIVSGPLKGGRALGKFAAKEELLILEFDTFVLGDKTYKASAVAIDPDTNFPGMATEVNRHYFTKIILPAAASFVSGMAEAFAQDDSTTVSVNNETVTSQQSNLDTEQEVARGLEEAASELEQIVEQEFGSRQTTIKVAPGTPMGLMFVESVVEDDLG